MSADMIVLADRIHTMDPHNPAAECVAMTDGMIVGIGDRADAREWRGGATEVIDLGAATVTPGLVDGHIHPMLGLSLTRGVDLSAVTTYDGLIDALRAAPREEWLLGWGLNPNVFGTREVTAEPITTAVGEVLALIIMFDGHSAIASPAALRRAGITGPREFESKAEIACDENGTPTGRLVELPAYDIVRQVIPELTLGDLVDRLGTLLAGMAATGLTAGNAMDFDGRSDEVIAAYAADRTLPMRLRFAPMCLPGSGREYQNHIIDLQKLRGDRWQVEGVKFLIDGTIDGGTAWLEQPDTHGESTAPFWPEPREYTEAVRYLAAAGIPTATHAIGDAGVKYVLDALSGVPTPSVAGTRVPHRIEHVETIPASLVGRFRELDVTASMQPTHCTLYARADGTDNWSERLGPDRAARAFCTRDLREAGARVALGSDWPIAPYDARSVIADAQLRRPHGHPDVAPILPDQSLTARMALEGYTTHAAAAAGLSGVSGSLTVGKRADLAAFGLDPLTAPPDEFAQSPVPLTVVGGLVAHRNGD